MGPLPALAALLLALPAAPQGQVHVVDATGGPGSEFTSIVDAIAAAAEGDVVLVRTGQYDSVGIVAKSLIVVAERGAQVDCPSLFIHDLPADHPVVVQGLSFMRFDERVGSLELDEAPIWLERCSFEVIPGGFLTHSLEPVDCASVVLVRSQVLARGPLSGLSGIFTQRSRLHIYESHVESQDSVPAIAAGIAAREAFLEVYGSTVKGPDGLDGRSSSCDGMDGGPAVRLLSGGTSRLVTRDDQLLGGAGGMPFDESCDPGADGAEVEILSSSTWQSLSGPVRSHEVDSPVREDESLHLRFSGAPGDRVWILVSSRPGIGLASPFWEGEFLLDPPYNMISLGTLPPSGVLQFPFPAPDLPAGVESRVVFAQAIFRDAVSGRFIASSPTVTVILDSSL